MYFFSSVLGHYFAKDNN